MNRRHFLAALALLSVCGAVAAQPESETEALRLPHAGYVTCSGSFRLDGGTGLGLYIRPHTGALFTAHLTFHSYHYGIWWYREKGTAFYVGFAAYPSCGWQHPVYWGHYDTNGVWHWLILGWARRTPLGN